MRTALIADIHGNTVALQAVLSEIANLSVDQIVCLGDLAAGGPDPAGAVELVRSLGCPTVQGNTDADLLDLPAWWSDPVSVGAPESARRAVEIGRWCADQLNNTHRQYLESLPPTVEVDLGHGERLLGFHGSPRSATDTITDRTDRSTLDTMFGDSDALVFAGGHSHVRLLRHHQGKTVVNPGSVGMPFATYGFFGEVPIVRGASFAMVASSGAEADVEFRTVTVDEQELSESVELSGMPHGDWWLGLRS